VPAVTRTPVATGLAAVAALGCAAVLTTSSAQAETERSFLGSLGSPGARTTVDLGTPGPSTGDQTVYRYALDENGTRVGYLLQTCTVLERTASDTLSRCTGELSASGSTVVFQGLMRASRTTHRYAVLGGLGQYRSAGGELVIDTPAETATDQIRLSLD
jgi:hypothetical protein